MLSLAVAASLALALQAQAKVIDINVGKNGLTFEPASVTAALGDELRFHFYPNTHSVAQGIFSKACQASTASGAFYSGSQFVASGVGVSSPFLAAQILWPRPQLPNLVPFHQKAMGAWQCGVTICAKKSQYRRSSSS